MNISDDIYDMCKGTAQKNLDINDFKLMDILIPSIDLQKKLIEFCDNLTIQNNYYEKILKEEEKISKNYMFLMLNNFNKNDNIKQLGDICEFKNGKTITKKQLIEGDYPVIGGGVKPIGYHNEYNRDENTVLVSSSGSAGYVSKYNSKIWASDCISIFPNKEILNDYLYYYLKFIQNDIYELRTGTAQQHVYKHQLETLDIPILSVEDQKKFIEEYIKCEKNIKERIEHIKENIAVNNKLIDNFFKSIL